jgi:hypothetical protein
MLCCAVIDILHNPLLREHCVTAVSVALIQYRSAARVHLFTGRKSLTSSVGGSIVNGDGSVPGTFVLAILLGYAGECAALLL